MNIRVAFSAVVWASCVPLLDADDSHVPVSAPPGRSEVARESAADCTLLLNQLKRRDTQFDNRSLEVEQRWTEHVNPQMELMQLRFNNRKYGGRQLEMPADVKVPDSYDQPHRKHCLLTVRGSDTALDVLGDLAPPVKAELQMEKVRQAANYRRGVNDGSRWAAVGEVERHYNPNLNIVHVGGRGSVLKMYRLSYEWSCGYGFAKLMRSIDTIQWQDGLTLIEGTMRLLEDDKSHFRIQLDRNSIVRRAVISIPGSPDGFNEYTVETSGTSETVPGAPLVAKRGHYRRVLKPAGKREHVAEDYEVVFVSLSNPLTDEEYNRLTTITPKKDATIVDRSAH